MTVNVETDEILKKIVSSLHFDSRMPSKGGAGPGYLLRDPIPKLGLPAKARVIEAGVVQGDEC